MTRESQDRTAIVTGGARGIGAGVAAGSRPTASP